MLRVLLKGSLLSRSGYGEMSRTIYDALSSRPDLFDLYIVPTTWGATSWTTDTSEYRQKIDQLIAKTHYFNQNKIGYYDVAIQVTIPSEFEKIGIINIGYTAGVETTKISKLWIEKSNLMDKLVVISNFSKYAFENTVYNVDGKELRCNVPIDVVHFPSKSFASKNIDLELKDDFNFLTVSQWGPRKNLENLICWFVEEFKNEEVGLVVKTSKANNSVVDRYYTSKHLKSLLSKYPDRKCSVYLLHGNLDNNEMSALYNHDKIKAFINLSHGEGYGLPMFDAATNGMPVIAPNWSGHLDFMTKDKKPLFAKVDYELAPVQKEVVWENVIIPDSMWAFPNPRHFKEKMRSMVNNYGSWKKKAVELQEHVLKTFTEEKINNDFVGSICGHKEKNNDNQFNGVSFCIPTNGMKLSKTLALINSLKRMNNNKNIEIIVAGNIVNLNNIEGIITVDAAEDSFNGKLAHLRNVAARKATKDVLCFVDDDFLFPQNWLDRFFEFSKNNEWDVLGNRIHNPDGTRFWDRSIMNPHCLVTYEHPWFDKNIYQTGGFFIITKDVYDECKWDGSIGIYAEKENKKNEDIDYCQRLHFKGFKFGFDKDNFVYHSDNKYTQMSSGVLELTLRKEEIEKHLGKQVFLPECEEYLSMVEINK